MGLMLFFIILLHNGFPSWISLLLFLILSLLFFSLSISTPSLSLSSLSLSSLSLPPLSLTLSLSPSSLSFCFPLIPFSFFQHLLHHDSSSLALKRNKKKNCMILCHSIIPFSLSLIIYELALGPCLCIASLAFCTACLNSMLSGCCRRPLYK